MSLLIITLAPKVSKKLPGALLAIIIVTAIVALLKDSCPWLAVETIGDRFGSLPTDIPEPHSLELNMATINLLLPSAFSNYSADTLMRKLKLLPTGSDNDLSIL